MIRTVTATEYVTPLREGGSLPAIVEGDDDGTYVMKFRGAGQGPRALVAELISGEIARALALPIPEIVFVELDPRMAKTEPDPEIQDLLRKSEGLNLGLDYLPGSITFDAMVTLPLRDRERLASSIVWFDALVTNVDRTAKNANLLVWHRDLWLIDHGATLIFHHNWNGFMEGAPKPFLRIHEHILMPWAAQIAEVDASFTPLLTREKLDAIIAMVPEEWLGDEEQFPTVAEHRAAYRDYLLRRLETPRAWVEEAVRARTIRV
jgi:hypothetical protein